MTNMLHVGVHGKLEDIMAHHRFVSVLLRILFELIRLKWVSKVTFEAVSEGKGEGELCSIKVKKVNTSVTCSGKKHDEIG